MATVPCEMGPWSHAQSPPAEVENEAASLHELGETYSSTAEAGVRVYVKAGVDVWVYAHAALPASPVAAAARIPQTSALLECCMWNVVYAMLYGECCICNVV